MLRENGDDFFVLNVQPSELESLSLQYSTEAHQLQNQGDFSKAIDLQIQSILIYKSNPDLAFNFYRLGNTYYLYGDYKLSLMSYEVFNNLVVIKNPNILKDYKMYGIYKMYSMTTRLNVDKERLEKFYSSFFYLAYHVGHSIEDCKNINTFYREILQYKNQLKGRVSEDNSHATLEASMRYDKKCIFSGFHLIFTWMNKFCGNRPIQLMQKYTDDLMDFIFNSDLEPF